MGELRFNLEPFSRNLIGRLAVEHALAAVVVGGVKATQELVQGAVRVNVDAQHLRADAAVEALHYAIRQRRAQRSVSILGAEFGAGPGKSRREAAAVVGQHVGELDRKRRCDVPQKGDGIAFRLIVIYGQVHRTEPAVNGDEQKALPLFAVDGLELRQVLDVDVCEAEFVVVEGALSLGGTVGIRLGAAVQALGLQKAKYVVTIEMRQEVTHHEGEVIEWKVGGALQFAHHGELLLDSLPRQAMWTCGAVKAVGGIPSAPLANRFGTAALTTCDGAAELGRACDLGPNGGRGAGISMNEEQSLSRRRTAQVRRWTR